MAAEDPSEIPSGGKGFVDWWYERSAGQKTLIAVLPVVGLLWLSGGFDTGPGLRSDEERKAELLDCVKGWDIPPDRLQTDAGAAYDSPPLVTEEFDGDPPEWISSTGSSVADVGELADGSYRFVLPSLATDEIAVYATYAARSTNDFYASAGVSVGGAEGGDAWWWGIAFMDEADNHEHAFLMNGQDWAFFRRTAAGSWSEGPSGCYSLEFDPSPAEMELWVDRNGRALLAINQVPLIYTATLNIESFRIGLAVGAFAPSEATTVDFERLVVRERSLSQ